MTDLERRLDKLEQRTEAMDTKLDDLKLDLQSAATELAHGGELAQTMNQNAHESMKKGIAELQLKHKFVLGALIAIAATSGAETISTVVKLLMTIP